MKQAHIEYKNDDGENLIKCQYVQSTSAYAVLVTAAGTSCMNKWLNKT